MNQRISIMLDQYPGDHFNSRVEDMFDNTLTIAMPLSKGYPVYLSHGSCVYGKVFAEGAVYQFKASLLEKRLHPLPVWVISIPHNLRKIQMRAFVRVEAMLPVKTTILHGDEEETAPMNLVTKDVSGGGLRIVCKHMITVGSRLRLVIEIPENGHVETFGEVVRVDKPDNESQVYWIGAKYLNITEALRNKIIKFVFKKQLEYRQKGL